MAENAGLESKELETVYERLPYAEVVSINDLCALSTLTKRIAIYGFLRLFPDGLIIRTFVPISDIKFRLVEQYLANIFYYEYIPNGVLSDHKPKNN
jgi:hypothetical protein